MRLLLFMTTALLAATFPALAQASEPIVELVCEETAAQNLHSEQQHQWFIKTSTPTISCEEKAFYNNLTDILYGSWAVFTFASMCDPTVVLSKSASFLGYHAIMGLKIYIHNLECIDTQNEKLVKQQVKEQMCRLLYDQGEDCDLRKIKIDLEQRKGI